MARTTTTSSSSSVSTVHGGTTTGSSTRRCWVEPPPPTPHTPTPMLLRRWSTPTHHMRCILRGIDGRPTTTDRWQRCAHGWPEARLRRDQRGLWLNTLEERINGRKHLGIPPNTIPYILITSLDTQNPRMKNVRVVCFLRERQAVRRRRRSNEKGADGRHAEHLLSLGSAEIRSIPRLPK
jgi:hypothetical protein